jgi:hypothetical protein
MSETESRLFPENEPPAKTQWWRWPLIPIAAVLGAFAAALLMAGFQWLSIKFMGGGTDGWLFKYIVPLMSAGAFGWAFVRASCEVAPRGKFITGIVMATILTLFNIVVAAFILLRSTEGWGAMLAGVLWGVVATVVGIVALMQFRTENPDS